MTLWQIGCALAPNMASIIVFRFLGGIGGSACLTIGGGIIADLFPIHERGLGNAVFASGPVLGPVIGPIPFGFGMMGIFVPIQTYFIDVGGRYAASAVAALTSCRCLFGGLLPLAGPKMFSSLGLGWGNSLLGFIALGLIPAPALIYRFGGAIRKRFPVVQD